MVIIKKKGKKDATPVCVIILEKLFDFPGIYPDHL